MAKKVVYVKLIESKKEEEIGNSIRSPKKGKVSSYDGKDNGF